ncbi:PTS sugar transporter subunit IIA [Pullulanibacillus camelliae]|uniref:PTS sugar transporter subunit IIA n=1 Tax=Pullulanibacillus camelliae TaxID=1707096 RepID=A0A8J3E0B3_9BACL|nr:PTS sugar transporter subunit IIA [Pullulanibacillus camelliae]GGE53315.1 PTS sugar transporter subunit IIA [Pullulanibacillus camelliae]
MKFLEKNLVELDAAVTSPDEAIQTAGNLLVEEGLVEEQYVEAMVQSYHKNGPYFVLAPQIALPHARPEDGVKEASVSFLRLMHPVRFGSAVNDPVHLVFALGASSSDEHLEILQKLMALLNNPENVKKLMEMTAYSEMESLLGGIHS